MHTQQHLTHHMKKMTTQKHLLTINPVHGITKELMNLTTIVKLIESRNNVGKMWNLNKDTT
jgi:hypothetical protein